MNRWVLALLFLLPLSVAAQRHEMRREGRVLAHSLRFDPEIITEDMPAGLQDILRSYKTGKRYANRVSGKAVEPLLKSVRHQEEPYNRSCPYYMYEDSTLSETRCLTGCVAVCIEQVLNYYKHPAELLDTLHGWETENYVIADVMPGTKIDWANVLDNYDGEFTDAQAQAEADLVYYCGVAAHMSWGVNSSGANLSRAFWPLYSAFDYKTIAFVQRGLYDNDSWNAMLRNELENGRPICYTGHNMALSGHAFNIDGVDEDGYYHLNWGYGGDYDGYFDLDYLNPFENPDDATEVGRNQGFFSNQTALFMHPEDFVIDIYDTLTQENAFRKVTVDTVTFRREPATVGYTIADFSLTNTTQDTLNFTFEVLTYLPSDTAVFMQADYVGLTAVNLLPGEHKTWPVYLQFDVDGERIFSFSADDETLPYQMPISIAKGSKSQLTFGQLSREDIAYGDNLTSIFTLPVTNTSTEGCAGELLTFFLVPQSGSSDYRHWQVLQLPAGEMTDCEVSFQHLVDGETYELYVRDASWVIQASHTFTYNAVEAVDAIEYVAVDETANNSYCYDLAGRRAINPTRGLVIRNGKKMWLR